VRRGTARLPPQTNQTADLRRAGLRVTPARLAVLAALRGRRAPASHADLASALGGAVPDRATVYRNLVELVKAGLARRRDLGDHVWRFEAAGARPGGREHPHFLCTACGSLACLDTLKVSLRRGARVPRALRDDAVEILVKGHCDECQAKRDRGEEEIS
jgi:Fur family transcriptional regulator, ferric uptake regulator